MINKFRIRYLFAPLSGREKWLNQMAASGYRLKGVSKLHRYSFEPCSPDEYEYRVEFAADRSADELRKYRAFLSELGITAYPVSANLGKYSYGSVRLRWFGGARFSLAASPGNINSEFLILEKKKDGKPFQLHSDLNSLLEYMRKCRGACLSLAVLFALFTIMNLSKGLWTEALLCALAFVIPFIFTTVWSWKIHLVQRDHKIHE
ncbi:DUF2812 domain-containing protein [Caproicibacter sp.]|uniref:DUF2812 domain-containing protein n=1 Tax=Caproicibacter sp. TaxID=2814884 RepID=UPI003988D2DA